MRGIAAWGVVVLVATGCVLEGAPPNPDAACPAGARTWFTDEVIFEDQTWLPRCGPYRVEGALRIEQAARLRIQAGVEVRFGSGARIVVGERTSGMLEVFGQPESKDLAGRIIRQRRPVTFVAATDRAWAGVTIAAQGSALLREVEISSVGLPAALALQGGSLSVDGAAFTGLAGSALTALPRYLAPPRPSDPPEWGLGNLQVIALTTDGSGDPAALRLHWTHVSSLAPMLDLASGQHIALFAPSDEVIGSIDFHRQRTPYRVGAGWGPGFGAVWTLYAGVTLEVVGGAEGFLDLRSGRFRARGLPDLPVEVRSPSGLKGSWRGVAFTWGQFEYQNLIVTGGGAAWHSEPLLTGAYHHPNNHASLVAWGVQGWSGWWSPPGLTSELLVRRGQGFLGIYPCHQLPFARGAARLEEVDHPEVRQAWSC